MTRTSSYQPTELAIFIGAGMGDAFVAKLEGDAVRYSLGNDFEGASETVIPVTAGRWRDFRKRLDKLAAFAWSGHYEPPPEEFATDGVDWKISITYADGATIQADGYDAYPPDGAANEFSKPFKLFCRAVSRLLAGVEFGWEVAKAPEPKGSRLRMYEWVHQHREQLDRELCRQVSSLGEFVMEPGSSINWIAPTIEGKEIRDGIWSKVLPPPTPQEDGFWLVGGPVWDAAGIAGGKHDPGIGIVLIEAKAHAAELVSPRMEPSTSEIDDQRRAALDEAKLTYGVDPPVPWTLTYYQLANRLAFLYYLRVRRKQPAWLINLYFFGDSFSSGSKQVEGPPDAAGWTEALTEAKRALGLGKDHPLKDFVADVFLPAIP